jgi:hypothetical protein
LHGYDGGEPGQDGQVRGHAAVRQAHRRGEARLVEDRAAAARGRRADGGGGARGQRRRGSRLSRSHPDEKERSEHSKEGAESHGPAGRERQRGGRGAPSGPGGPGAGAVGAAGERGRAPTAAVPARRRGRRRARVRGGRLLPRPLHGRHARAGRAGCLGHTHCHRLVFWLSLPGVRLVTWTVQADIERDSWLSLPGVASDWLRGTYYRLSSTEPCFDCTK